MAKQQKKAHADLIFPDNQPKQGPKDLYNAAMAEYHSLSLHAPAMQRALLSELVKIRTLMEFIIND